MNTQIESIRTGLRTSLLSGAAAIGLLAALASPAHAVVSRDDVGQNGTRDVNNTFPWVGQMIDWSSAPTLSFGLCTGTVIAPRVVLFAAHCVGGIGGTGETFGTGAGKNMVFGFNNNNLPGLRRYVGLDPSSAAVGQTNVSDNFYRVVDVIVHPRNGDNSFIAGTADVALAVLDTPVEGFDGHAMLFDQLTALENIQIAGFGNRGVAATGQTGGIDWWRRVGDNALSALMSDNAVFASNLFGNAPPFAGWDGANYWTDCDSATVPRPAGDFNIFGGAALPNEACIAQGDSGGAMWITRGGQKVAVGVASYGYSFGPSFGHGAISAHTALFPYWDFIVANNAYVYANAKLGGGAWENAATWSQALNPNYMIQGPGGTLVNALPAGDPISNTGVFTQVGAVRALPVSPVPNSIAEGTAIRVDIDGNVISNTQDGNSTGRTVTFGEAITTTATTAGGESNPDVLPIPPADPAVGGVGSGFWPVGTTPLSGPGSTGFVPNNTNGVIGTPFTNNARFYEVTLSNAGTTTLSSGRTIDRLNVSGASAKLQINAVGGDLRTVMASNVTGGNLTVNGAFRTRGLTQTGGFIQGTGLIDLSSVVPLRSASAFIQAGGTIAPGNSIGTLSIVGNFAQSPNGLLQVELTNGSSDVLAVTGNAIIAGSAQFLPFGPSPLVGQSYNFLTTTGSLTGQFSSIQDLLPGALFPVVTYGSNFAKVTIADFCFFASGPVETPVCQAIGNSTVQSDPDMIPAIAGLQALNPSLIPSALEALNPTRANAQTTVGFTTGDLLKNQFGRRTHDLLGGADGLETARADLTRSQLASATPSPEALAAAATAAVAATASGPASINLENGYGLFFAGDVALFDIDQAGGIGTDVADASAMTVGIDHSDGNGLVAGLAVSYLQSNVDQSYGLGGDTSSDGLAVSAYASYNQGRFYADMYASGAWHSFETERTLLLAPGVFGLASGETDASQIQVGTTFGYNLVDDGFLSVGAIGGLYFVSLDVDGYTETGVGPLGAVIGARSVESLKSQIGGEFALNLDPSKSTIVPLLRVVWNHEFMDDPLSVSSAFVGAPAVTFNAPGPNLGSDWATIGLGISSQVSANTNFYIRVQQDVGRDGEDKHEVSAAARFGF